MYDNKKSESELTNTRETEMTRNGRNETIMVDGIELKVFVSEDRLLEREMLEMGVHQDTIDEMTTEQKRSYVTRD